MTQRKILIRYGLLSACLLLSGNNAFSRIPEPDNVIYGLPGQDVTTVSLRRGNESDGEILATYAVGPEAAAGDFYVLRVPIDAVDPPTSGTARQYEITHIWVLANGITVRGPEFIIPGRGILTQLDLDGMDWTDTDGDGIPDSEDTDDDDDGVPDEEDAFPLDSAEWEDNDDDGIGNNADPDDDNDGVPDDEDNCPLIANWDQRDSNFDGIGDVCDGTADFCWECLPGRGGWRAIPK